MSARELPDVRVGQVWADCDWRATGRLVRVVGVPTPEQIAAVPNPGYLKATVEVVRSRDGATGPEDARARSRRRAIRLERFRPGSTGYRLVEGES